MQTIEEFIENKLMENGLSPEDAILVMELIKNHEMNQAMIGRWQESVSAYPEGIIHLAWVSAKDVTLEWIKLTCPEAWFRPMFDSEMAKKVMVEIEPTSNETDVEVIEVDTLDEDYQKNFKLDWLVQWPDGKIKEFSTEKEACAEQRDHRKRVRIDSLTGC